MGQNDLFRICQHDKGGGTTIENMNTCFTATSRTWMHRFVSEQEMKEWTWVFFIAQFHKSEGKLVWLALPHNHALLDRLLRHAHIPRLWLSH